MTLPWGSSRFDQAAAHVVGGGIAPGSWGLINHIAKGSPDSANVDTTPTPINTTGADLLVAIVGSYSGGSVDGFSDTVGAALHNSWTPLTSYTVGSTRATLYWSTPTHVGSDHIFTVFGTSSYCCLTVAVFSGSHASPFDVQAGGGATSATASAGSGITPTQNSELIIAGVSINGASVSSIDPGFSIIDGVSFSSGVHLGCSLAWGTQTAAVPVNPNWALSGSTDWSAAIASFKAA
jgi:hypothetical protein